MCSWCAWYIASNACSMSGVSLLAELERRLVHLRLRHAGGEAREHDVRVPPVRLDLGDPAEGVAVDAEQPFDDGRGDPPETSFWISGTMRSSSSRIRSSGSGSAKPTASRSDPEELQRDTGLRWRRRGTSVELSGAIRSYSGASSHPNESSPASSASRIASSGSPARSRLWYMRVRLASPSVNVPSSPGARTPTSTSLATKSRSTPARSATSRFRDPAHAQNLDRRPIRRSHGGGGGWFVVNPGKEP